MPKKQPNPGGDIQVRGELEIKKIHGTNPGSNDPSKKGVKAWFQKLFK